MQKQPSYQQLKTMLENAEKLIEAQKERMRILDELHLSNQSVIEQYQVTLDKYEQVIRSNDMVLETLKQEFPEVKELLERYSIFPWDSPQSW